MASELGQGDAHAVETIRSSEAEEHVADSASLVGQTSLSESRSIQCETIAAKLSNELTVDAVASSCSGTIDALERETAQLQASLEHFYELLRVMQDENKLYGTQILPKLSAITVDLQPLFEKIDLYDTVVSHVEDLVESLEEKMIQAERELVHPAPKMLKAPVETMTKFFRSVLSLPSSTRTSQRSSVMDGVKSTPKPYERVFVPDLTTLFVENDDLLLADEPLQTEDVAANL